MIYRLPVKLMQQVLQKPPGMGVGVASVWLAINTKKPEKTD